MPQTEHRNLKSISQASNSRFPVIKATRNELLPENDDANLIYKLQCYGKNKKNIILDGTHRINKSISDFHVWFMYLNTIPGSSSSMEFLEHRKEQFLH